MLAEGLQMIGPFEMIHSGKEQEGIPALTWKIKDGAKTNYRLYDLADHLRTRGWLVPAYSLPPHADNIIVQRILVKQGLSADMASLLLEDFKRSIDFFDSHQPHGFTGKEAQMGNHSGR